MDGSDDIACWERNKNEKIIIIHDYASEGYENVREFDNFGTGCEVLWKLQ